MPCKAINWHWALSVMKLVSACLIGVNCNFEGKNWLNPLLFEEFAKGGLFLFALKFRRFVGSKGASRNTGRRRLRCFKRQSEGGEYAGR